MLESPTGDTGGKLYVVLINGMTEGAAAKTINDMALALNPYATAIRDISIFKDPVFGHKFAAIARDFNRTIQPEDTVLFYILAHGVIEQRESSGILDYFYEPVMIPQSMVYYGIPESYLKKIRPRWRRLKPIS